MTYHLCSLPVLRRLATTLILPFVIAGCAYIPQKPLVDGATSAAPAPVAAAAVNGSIFQSGQAMNYGYQPLFEDRRPRNIGDTLTIVLQENVSASKSSSANASRDGSTDVGITAVPGFMSGLVGRGKADASFSGSNDFAGKGGAAAKNTFSGTITVTVKQVLENGNLAVVVDDHFQGITEIVRGADLIEPTVRQISLYQHFGWQAPDYLHLPLALNGDGNKLSKQNHAPALPEGDPRPEIVRALRFLNQAIPEEWQALSIDDLLAQAVANWQPAKIEHSQMAPAEL